jgi:hypothetical protein
MNAIPSGTRDALKTSKSGLAILNLSVKRLLICRSAIAIPAIVLRWLALKARIAGKFYANKHWKKNTALAATARINGIFSPDLGLTVIVTNGGYGFFYRYF